MRTRTRITDMISATTTCHYYCRHHRRHLRHHHRDGSSNSIPRSFPFANVVDGIASAMTMTITIRKLYNYNTILLPVLLLLPPSTGGYNPKRRNGIEMYMHLHLHLRLRQCHKRRRSKIPLLLLFPTPTTAAATTTRLRF